MLCAEFLICMCWLAQVSINRHLTIDSF